MTSIPTILHKRIKNDIAKGQYDDILESMAIFSFFMPTMIMGTMIKAWSELCISEWK